ncbi:MAG: S9 family peptidase [Ardenticatenales bacterium]|nr:S9 family peptidase [Ardenticatenales bacterium]
MSETQYEFEQFSAVRNYGDLSFSPDGQWVTYVTNATGQLNVWKQPVHLGSDGRPSAPVQLTNLTENSARRAIWSPGGEMILTMADKHGNENFQLYQVPADNGWLYPLTEAPDVRHELPGQPFSPDGQLIAYACNGRSRANLDIMLRERATGESRILLQGDGNFVPGAWSPDGQYLLGIEIGNNMDSNIYLIHVASGEHKLLTPHEGDVRYLPGEWHPDGSGFYLVSDHEREFNGLAFYRLADNSFNWLVTPDWDVEASAISPDGGMVAWQVNEDGYSRLYVREAASGAVKQIMGLPAGVMANLRFSPTEPLLGFYVHRPVGPGELYMLNLETGQHWQLSQAFLGGIPAEAMVEPELIRYPTHDGREIPAFLFKPKRLPPGKRAPVVLSIHGGPESQERPAYSYNGFYQFLLNRGIGVLATNVRGSTGYGKSYQKLIHRDWGGAELKDFEHAARYLQSLDWVAPDKLGVFGGSFGGFATLSCVTRLPQYWAAAVDIVGPSNLVTFTKAVPEFWKRYMKAWVGDPDEDRDMLLERSPISYVNNIEAPLLILQGANDPRVVQAESDQMVAQLEQLGREVDYMVFEDEGHGFTKTSNIHKAFRATADWFLKHLA